MSALKLLEFFQPGCPHCARQRKLEVMEHLAAVYPDVVFERVNATERPDLADHYDVERLPSYVVVSSLGVRKARLDRAATVDQLRDLLDQARAA